jgi:hypothetical protein
MVELYLHSPNSLHDNVLHELCYGINLRFTYLLKTHFNIIFPSPPRSINIYLSLGTSKQSYTLYLALSGGKVNK